MGISTEVARRTKAGEKPSTLHKRADGRIVRQMTIFLPEELRKKLLHYCVENDREISGVIEEAVVKLLDVVKNG